VNDETRFWAKVDRRGDDECWPWTATTNRKGYGRFWDGTRLVSAHRWAYERHVGPIPEGLKVCHRCDNPPCVNYLRCLFLGDDIVNMGDMMAKGRQSASRTGASAFAGVSLHRRMINGRQYEYWRARISIHGTPIHIGQFASAEEAAAAYDEVAIRYGLQRRLNGSAAEL
jgi:hypothetical protein